MAKVLSIITVNYNNKDGLRKTIDSVLAQTCRDFEFIIVDGASTDGGVDVIKEYAERIDIWSSEPDKGVYNAMNKGVKAAHGEYCLFLNSGDTFYDNDVVKNVIGRLSEGKSDIMTGGTWLSFGRLVQAPQSVSMAFLYKWTLSHQASFIRRKLLLQFPYDETLRYVADWKFWVEALVLHDCSYSPLDVLIANYDWNGMSTVHYKDVDKEKDAVRQKLLPPKILQDYHKFTIGDNWEDKLYIAIKDSRFHGFLYTVNVLLIKFLQMLRKGPSWIAEYPIKLK